ncbi:hypothetical protein JXD38_11540, partial [candidate division WOR-3 bacterium]|nr:hypothetical protein [candidate division WOR-3 bacterium]
FVCFSQAQSFFNSRGLGEITPSGEARVAGLAEPSALSTLNPGIFVGLDQTSFHLTALGAAVHGTQYGNSRLLGEVQPAAFNVATPLPFETRLFAGINQKFSQDFNVWSESLADTAYRRHIVGRGGIYSLRVGLAKAFFDRVCIGAEFDHIMGGSRENWRFELENGGYTSTDTIEVDYVGNTFKVGGSFQSRTFSLAAFYEPALDLRARRDKRVHGVITDTTRYYDISLPHSYSLAAAISPANRIGFDIGLTVRPWQGATITQADSASRLGYKNVWRGSIGAEYEVDSLHPVRIGYSRQTWYYGSAYYSYWGRTGPIAINEDGIHLGTSVPIPKFGSLDISGELLIRDSHLYEGIAVPPEDNPGSLREFAGRLMLTLSYSEAWLKRTRRWGY